MNRRSFIRTTIATGVSLFLPKVIEPMRWKKPEANRYWCNTFDNMFQADGFYMEPTPRGALSKSLIRNDGLDDAPFTVVAWSNPLPFRRSP